MAAASTTLPSLEAMGPLRLPSAPPPGRERTRCLADGQIGPRAVAAVAHPGAVAGADCGVLCCLGVTEPGGAVAMFIESPWYVIRMPGGVGVEAS